MIVLKLGAVLIFYCAVIHGQVDDNFIFPSSFSSFYNDSTKTHVSSWAIRIPSSLLSEMDRHKLADRIANDVGLENRGQIGGLTGHYLLYHKSFLNHTIDNSHNQRLQIVRVRKDICKLLESHPHVEWYHHETILHRMKRSLQFLDQYFPNQWHLVSTMHN